MTKPKDDHYCHDVTKCYVSCMRMPYAKLEHFEVPEPVYVYIRQLEAEILFNKGVVQRLYRHRFTNNPNAPESDA
jgi:hypothetical protein